MDLMGKLAAAGSAIKNARLPSPGEIKEGYLNSAFHKSLHQPLMVKSKVEKTDVQKARQAITQVIVHETIKFIFTDTLNVGKNTCTAGKHRIPV